MDKVAGDSIRCDGIVARIGGATFPVIDLSNYGVRLSTRTPIAEVDTAIEVDLTIPLTGTQAIYRADARVVWSGSKETGLAFTEPGTTWQRIVKTPARRPR